MKSWLLVGSFIFWGGDLQAKPPLKSSPQVEIRNQKFTVELARSPEEWRRGLMFRDHLGSREGMLFISNTERPQSFWMKNTPLSLDIIFISSDRRIVAIARETQPLSEKPILSGLPAQFVLEVRAGTARALKWSIGDRVEFQNIPP
jgi:hypothetical protein